MSRMKSRIVPALLLGGLLALAAPTLSLAHGDSGADHHNPTAEERLAALETREAELAATAAGSNPRSYEERLKAVEERQAELYHTLAEKKEAGLATRIAEKITISGLIELEGSLEGADLRDGTDEAASDLVLATAQLGLGVEVAKHLTADLTLLFEEDATDLEVDEAAVNLSNDVFFGRFGRQYLPFGVFHSHFISDPLTLALGETRETALLAGYRRDLFTLSAFVFNGDAEKLREEDHIRDWGASLTVTPLEGLELGGSYLADLADTDAGLLAERDNLFTRRVGGWSAYALLERWNIGLSGEVLGAARSFAAADLDADGDGKGDRPLAWNLELAIHPRENLELAARLEGSDEFAGQPELQYGLGASLGLHDNVTLSLEYLRGEFDQAFGGGLDKRHLVTAQLAFEF